MRGIDRRGDTPMGPPWPVDVLADLHAGVLDAAVADELWPQVRHDADAAAVLAALDATRAELAGVAAAPTPPMPRHVAARLEAAIAAEARAAFSPQAPAVPTAVPAAGPPAALPPTPPPAPVVDIARARRKRGQRLGWAAGALVAAAAVAVVVIAIPKGGSPGTGIAAPPKTGVPTRSLSSGQLGSATLAAAIGRTDYGPLTDPAKLGACLSANQQDPTRRPAGAMQVTLDGKPGVLLVLTTGTTAQYRLLVVGDDCAAGNPAQLADTVVGGLLVPTH